MKLALLHDMSLKVFDRADAAKPEPAVFQIVDDSFSEAINFRFRLRGVVHRGLVTYDALRHGCETDELREPALALFIRHARRIGASAARKFRRSRREPVVLDAGEL